MEIITNYVFVIIYNLKNTLLTNIGYSLTQKSVTLWTLFWMKK